MKQLNHLNGFEMLLQTHNWEKETKKLSLLAMTEALVEAITNT